MARRRGFRLASPIEMAQIADSVVDDLMKKREKERGITYREGAKRRILRGIPESLMRGEIDRDQAISLLDHRFIMEERGVLTDA